MNRPIEFRLVDKEGNIVGYERHDAGLIYHRSPESDDYPIYPICTNEWEYYIPHDSLDQLTPYTDKEGNKIWENDRLKRKDSRIVDLVVFDSGSFCVRHPDGTHDFIALINHFKNIGRIHTHPELEGGGE